MKQQNFNLYQGTRGGRRPGVGRKRTIAKGVAHSMREKVTARTPLHVNFKFKVHIRNKDGLKLLKKAVQNARKTGLKIIHYSLQFNHLHFILEATDNQTLSAGMRSLTVTFAKGLKAGKVQIERYHLHVLKTLRETRHAINYVLFNEQKHSQKSSKVDAYSSLLLLPQAHKLIREYARESGSVITVNRSVAPITMDQGRSYFVFKALGML